MKRNLILVILLFTFTQIIFGQTPNAWINEFHYTNIGTDTGEFIEIVIQNADIYGELGLADFRIALYKDNGTRYGPYHYLSSFTVGGTDLNDESFTYYYKDISGLQNGHADGFSLTYNTEVLQFISYGGVLTATVGDAIGLTSTDIGVAENSNTPIGYSLQLSGSGTQYDDFVWIPPSPEAKGTTNGEQALPVELTTFAATTHAKGVKLNWSTATEVNNYGFEIERNIIGNWTKIGFVNGHGNSNSPKDYSFVDKSAIVGEVSYRLKQIDTDGAFEYSDVVTVTSTNLAKYELYQNHPNPFNPNTIISFSLLEVSIVKLTVYNAIGQKVMELANEQMDVGFHKVNFDASNLSSGFYFYRLETPNYSKTIKMILLR